jgi:hypothetical protein
MSAMVDIEPLFSILTSIAMAGDRCPNNDGLQDLLHRAAYPTINIQNALTRLTRDGRIRVEVGGMNYRVIKIMEGRAAGKRTAVPSGAPWRPRLIIGVSGQERPHSHLRRGKTNP